MSLAAAQETPPVLAPPPGSRRALRWAIVTLTGTVWASGALFAAFILAFYFGAMRKGEMAAWNSFLPGLHAPGDTLAGTVGIGVHFALGAVILLLGPVQLMGSVRRRWPALHRRIGWVYASSAVLTGLGGLTFIGLRGTVGGPAMSLSFALYGVLMVLAAVQAMRHAAARRLEAHRGWAIRLFALAVGSWLYRMDYGFWFLFFGDAGHTDTFDGWFDKVMNLWFFLPNLLVAELAIRARRPAMSDGMRWASAALLGGVTAFLLLATYFFLTQAWWPAIVWGIAPSA